MFFVLQRAAFKAAFRRALPRHRAITRLGIGFTKIDTGLRFIYHTCYAQPYKIAVPYSPAADDTLGGGNVEGTIVSIVVFGEGLKVKFGNDAVH